MERLARLSAQVTPPAPERDALNEEGSDRARPEKKAGAEPGTEYYDRRAVAEVDHPCAEEPEDNGQGAVGHEEAGDVVRFHRRLPVSQRSPQYRAPSRGRISRARMYR